MVSVAHKQVHVHRTLKQASHTRRQVRVTVNTSKILMQGFRTLKSHSIHICSYYFLYIYSVLQFSRFAFSMIYEAGRGRVHF